MSAKNFQTPGACRGCGQRIAAVSSATANARAANQFLAGLAKSVYGQANSAGRGRDDFAAVFDFLQKPG